MEKDGAFCDVTRCLCWKVLLALFGGAGMEEGRTTPTGFSNADLGIGRRLRRPAAAAACVEKLDPAAPRGDKVFVDSPQVPPQVGHDVKGPGADGAAEGLLLAVHQHVLLQLALRGECLGAVAAPEGLHLQNEGGRGGDLFSLSLLSLSAVLASFCSRPLSPLSAFLPIFEEGDGREGQREAKRLRGGLGGVAREASRDRNEKIRN